MYFEAIRKIPGPIVLAVDGVIVGPGQWQEKDGRGTYLPQYSGPGDHVVTLVQFQDDGYVNVSAATYTVRDSSADVDTTLPRTPAGVTPYHGDDGATQNATEVLNAYLKAVRDGDEAAFAATLYPLDKGKASDLFAEERALVRARTARRPSSPQTRSSTTGGRTAGGSTIGRPTIPPTPTSPLSPIGSKDARPPASWRWRPWSTAAPARSPSR